jgi:hypothetical protein
MDDGKEYGIPFPGKSLTVLPHENFVALQGL